MVLHHAIRVQHVRPYLRTKINIELGIFQLLGDLTLLFQFVRVELGFQDSYLTFGVLGLRALVLARNHDPGRDMREPHGGVGCVHVLSAFAAGAVSVRADLFRLDIDLNGIVNFRRDKYAGKGSVPALGLVERGNAHQPVETDLASEQAISVIAVDGEGYGLDSRLFSRLVFVYLRGKALTLSPAQVQT